MLDHPWVSLIVMLAVTVAVIAMSYWFTRHVVGGLQWSGFQGQRNGGQLNILAQTQLGKEQRIAVLQAGERCFLLGLTPQNISLLTELTKEEAEQWQHTSCGAAQEFHFQQALLEKLQKRGSRGEKQ